MSQPELPFKWPTARQVARKKPTNVSQVRQLSPFRYPGGKTWCVPEIRRWLSGLPRPAVFLEPFAGGAVASLTAAVEDLAERVVIAEIDPEVAAVWNVLIHGKHADFEWLCSEIISFDVSRPSVERILHLEPPSQRHLAFRTILKNRVNRGGILAPGASLMKDGENGRGLRSRWYPATLVARLRTIRDLRSKLVFKQEDAFGVIARHSFDARAAFFVDPPYTAGGKRAGTRLYVHNDINHQHLFDMLSRGKGSFLATYDDAREVHEMAISHGFRVAKIAMKSTHHAVHSELIITRA
jgi:DNA adenine methylase